MTDVRTSCAVTAPLPDIGENEEMTEGFDLETGAPVAPEEIKRRMTVDPTDEPEIIRSIQPAKELEGWLSKESKHLKSLRKRYFVLKDRKLVYFKKQTDPQPHATIDLNACTVAPAERKQNDFFKLTQADGEVMILQCDSAEACAQWVEEIHRHIVEANRKVDLSSFELIRVIGRGAFGKVMLVRKKDNNKLYAMKVMHKVKLIKQKLVNQILDENQILRALEHPFVVGLQFAFQTSSEVYLVMDYINGGDMFGQMQKYRRFSADEARIFIGEMVLAFEHIHSQGIVYRDLKPENVLMGADGHLRLTDFGLSKTKMDISEKTHTFCGSKEYLAPEILRKKGYGREVDWWSVGVLTYEFLVGRPPFMSQNMMDLFDKILHAELEFPAQLAVPAEAQDLVRKFMVRDPTQRLGSSQMGGVEAIKSHPFFATLDWDKLYNKEIPAPIQPQIKGETDTQNFDECFTREHARVSAVTDVRLNPGESIEERFRGFTFDGTAPEVQK